jgi:cell division protein FtsQ
VTRRQHGAALNAPDEQGFVPGQDVAGEPRGPRARASSLSAPPSGLGRALRAVVSGVKLSAGVLVVVLASVAVAWGARRYALTTPRFSIRQIDVRGNRRLTAEQVEELAGVRAGENIFALDTDAAERRVLADPWVQEVKITRHLPGTLRVEVTERDASALAAIGGDLYLVTASGEPFKRFQSGDPDELPVITGVTPVDVARDGAAAVQRIGVGLEILDDYRRLPMSRFYPAEELHLSEAGGAVLTVGKSGVTLELGHGPWNKKLLMAARVMERLTVKNHVPAIVFLDNEAHPERVVVRLR